MYPKMLLLKDAIIAPIKAPPINSPIVNIISKFACPNPLSSDLTSLSIIYLSGAPRNVKRP